jgi:hypothetical protein
MVSQPNECPPFCKGRAELLLSRHFFAQLARNLSLVFEQIHSIVISDFTCIYLFSILSPAYPLRRGLSTRMPSIFAPVV